MRALNNVVEIDVNKKIDGGGAAKNDGGKTPLAIVPYYALAESAKALATIIGEISPSDRQGFMDSKLWLINSAENNIRRHLDNKENCKNHLAIAAAELLAALESDLKPTGDLTYLRVYAEMFDCGKAKYNKASAPLCIIPPLALNMVAEVFNFGRKKYALHNFKNGFETLRMMSAPLRHSQTYCPGLATDNEGLKLDPESSLNHLSHMIAGVFIQMETEHLGTATDDRFDVNNLSPESKQRRQQNLDSKNIK